MNTSAEIKTYTNLGSTAADSSFSLNVGFHPQIIIWYSPGTVGASWRAYFVWKNGSIIDSYQEGGTTFSVTVNDTTINIITMGGSGGDTSNAMAWKVAAIGVD